MKGIGLMVNQKEMENIFLKMVIILMYYKNNKIMFEGDWINDKLEGNGKYFCGCGCGKYYIGHLKIV